MLEPQKRSTVLKQMLEVVPLDGSYRKGNLRNGLDAGAGERVIKDNSSETDWDP